jgi:16S rRNA (guanine527-N7)-methyltransferase
MTPPPGFLGACAAMGIEFEPGEVEKLGRYLGLMLEVNKTTNLTAITDPGEAWIKHIQDSLTLIALLAELPDGSGVVDVGSGGGCPGIPLAVCMPHLRFALLEATGKKAAFLESVVEQLELKNVTVLNGRAETFAAFKSPHREAYDAAVARAVGPLSVVAELTVPFVKMGGTGPPDQGAEGRSGA